MNILNNEILLTIIEEGRVVRSLQSKRERIKFYYFERDNMDIKNPSEAKRTRQGFGDVEYYPLIPSECTRKIKLSEIFSNYAISDEAPFKVKKQKWNSMSKKQRLEYHLSEIAGNKEFTYEIIE
jgi:hypothetical protein